MTSAAAPDPAVDRRRPAGFSSRAAHSYDRFRPGCPHTAVASAVGSAHSVLDLGAGTGTLTRALSAAGAHQRSARQIALPEVAIAERRRLWTAGRR